MNRLSVVFVVFFALLNSTVQPVAAQVVVTGAAGGAFFKFAIPPNWNGDLFIWNEGLSLDPIKPFNPGAKQKLRDSYTPSGNVGAARILSLHTDKDGLSIVENENDYASKVSHANFTSAIVVENVPSHCGFTPAEALAGWESLRGWVAGAPQPTAGGIQTACQQLSLSPMSPGPCRIDPAFVAPSIDGRIRPR